jgi:hypothetical protein
MSTQTQFVEKARADLTEVEKQAYDMVSEQLLRDRLTKMTALMNAREQAAKNLYRANIEYEKKHSYPDEKKSIAIEHLITTIREYDAAENALKALQ